MILADDAALAGSALLNTADAALARMVPDEPSRLRTGLISSDLDGTHDDDEVADAGQPARRRRPVQLFGGSWVRAFGLGDE